MSQDGELAGLISGAETLGTVIDEGTGQRLLTYLDLLYRWNRTAGLTTIPRDSAMRLHILDSLTVRPLLPAGSVADLGTGAGLPGIPLAISDPALRFTLIESSRRKCSFLHEARRVLGLDLEIVEMDAEKVAGSGRRFRTVVSRAFRSPERMPALAHRLLAPGGHLVVMTTPGTDPESLEMADLSVIEELRVQLPQGGESRLLLKLRKNQH
ncbi:MAG TPA: 16S rRNA (guanine(527)-N(7))-methyltransferase RsmG [Candidatus Binatia bacterium]|nr:16S rRNA (guanine(527)-N(7))-methyltransferase RsmG [Candidatus Binatia bacterium]